jgi:hypothetical protein
VNPRYFFQGYAVAVTLADKPFLALAAKLGQRLK